MTAARILAPHAFGLAVAGWVEDEWPWWTRFQVMTLAGLCAAVAIGLAAAS